MDQISLYYQEGTSDKEYHAQIVPSSIEGLWNVRFQYGRRGNSLQSGVKNPQPVTRAQAQQIFNKLASDKEAKGYRRGETGTAYTDAPITPKQERQTGIFPQLLNPIDDAEMAVLITDDNWVAQPKIDGRRLLLRLADRGSGRSVEKTVTGINRLGFSVAIPRPIEAELLECPEPCLLDGEALGDRFHAFDVLEYQGRDVRGEPYGQRLRYLEEIIDADAPPDDTCPIGRVPTAMTTLQKGTLVEILRNANAEGVVFKNVNAPYVAGRPNAGGSARKYKFYETASCVVGFVNTRRSVRVGVYTDEDATGGGKVRRYVGNVTVPPNHPMPSVGQVVELRYLYCFPPPDGSLFQPTFLGVRDDIPAGDCTYDQLKIKPND